jgi:hypothetical protein
LWPLLLRTLFGEKPKQLREELGRTRRAAWPSSVA